MSKREEEKAIEATKKVAEEAKSIEDSASRLKLYKKLDNK